jgi:hypothetical protein
MKTRRFTLSSVLAGMALLALFVPSGAWPSLAQTQASGVELVGQIGGAIYAVAIQGSYAYVGVGPRLFILDVADPAYPLIVGQTAAMSGVVQDVTVAGNYAYVADRGSNNKGLIIINVADPTAPTEVGFYDAPSDVTRVAVAGNYAYITTESVGLHIINVSDPTAPTLASIYDMPGRSFGVALTSSYAYVANYDAGLRIINVANPAAPALASVYDTPGYARAVALVGNYAYVADGSGGLRIINVANPMAPFEVGFYNTVGYAWDVSVAGDYAYLAYGGSGLRIINVANPYAPTEVGFYDIPGFAQSATAAGNYVYFTDEDDELRIIDVTNPATPAEISSFDTPGWAFDVAVAGNYAYVAGYTRGLRLISVVNPAAPTEVGFYDTPWAALGVEAAGNYAYVADGISGLRIINTSDPAAPTEAGFYDTPDRAEDVAVAGNYAYVADGTSGLRIVSIINPTAPNETGSYDTPGYALGVAVAGNYAFIADEISGLRIINVSNPTSPFQIGFYDTPYLAEDVVVIGNYAYVADGTSGLHIVDVTNPAAPVQVSIYDDMLGYAKGVAVAGGYAYVADAYAGLRIIDITNPSTPSQAGFFATPSQASNVAVADDHIYVADGNSGLVILRHTSNGNDTTPPAAVTNLASAPGPNPGQVTLSWTAPGDDGSGDGPATEYDIRYSSTPINESNWASTTQVSGEPTPSNPGSAQQMTACCLTTGTRWYFAIETVDNVGNWSALSNVPSLQDIGLRPNTRGYRFPNYGGINRDDYTISDMRRMFGNDAVCWMAGTVCIVKPTAELWNTFANKIMLGGHCDGMASTSLRFFKGVDSLARFQPGANVTHDLQLGNVRRHIAYYFVEQLTDPVAHYKEQVRQNLPSATLNQLRSAMSGSMPDPTTLFVRQAGQGGHAITPYAIQERGNAVHWIWVYDNNHPDDANRRMTINTSNNTWRYNLGSGYGTWNGDANTHTLGVVPISEYAKQPVCPWCSGRITTLDGSSSGQVWLAGHGHLLITDSQGQRIGYMGSQFVNEVPGAYAGIIDGGLGIEIEPFYTLPLSDSYSILLDGQTLTQRETVAVAQFGPSYVASIGNMTLEPTSHDGLMFAPDGTELAFQPSDDNEATLTLALDGTSESNQVQIKGADISAGQVVTLTLDSENSQLVFNNLQSSGGEYDLEIHRSGTAGDQRFFHSELVILATDTHFVDYGGWDGSGPMTLYVDHGSDGTIDETWILDNEATRSINLPIILKDD